MPQNIEHCNYSLAYLLCCLPNCLDTGIAPSETEESCFIASSVTKTWLAHKVASAFPGIFIKLCSLHVSNISEILL